MKILGICGSPRKGNTEFMLRTVLDAAKSKGAKAELVLLREKNIEHCRGCLSCDKAKVCVIKDDMVQLSETLKGADKIIIGTPNYFDNLPGLLKDFIDRTNPYYETDALKDKKVIAIVVGGGETKNSNRVVDAIEYFTKAHKMKLSEKLTFQALNSNEVQKNRKVVEELKTLGESLA